MKEQASNVTGFYLIQGFGQDTCDVLISNDVAQFDGALVVVLYHAVAKVNMIGFLVSNKIVGHEHGSLAVYVHGEVNLRKLAKEVVEPQTALACVRHGNALSLSCRCCNKWLPMSESSNVITIQHVTIT